MVSVSVNGKETNRMEEKNYVFEQLVTLISAESIDGKEYSDGREKYVGKSGLLQLRAIPGGDEVHAIFHCLDSNGNVVTLRPSKGLYVMDEENVSVRTSRSRYSFRKNHALTRDEENKITEYALKNQRKENPEIER